MEKEHRMKEEKTEELMRGGTEKRGRGKQEQLKRKLAKVSAIFKDKRIDLPEQGKGEELLGWYEVYQLLVSSEQQLLTVQPQPSSSFIDKDKGAPAKNANNPDLWPKKLIDWKLPGFFFPKYHKY